MKTLRALALLLAFGVATTGLAATGPANKSSAVEISAVAERAFEDVTTCLTSGREKALDVFYLIDESGSLERTDPDQVRLEILENSVAELGSFVEAGITVRVAAAGFADGVRPLKDWETIESAANAVELGKRLGQQTSEARGAYRDRTDWEAGLRLARSFFNPDSVACGMLIWFTDGGINPGDNDPLGGLSNLCRPGINLDEIPTGPGPFGLMQEFRSAGIPVFGIYLSNEQEENEKTDDAVWLTSFMRPLVEGRGQLARVDLLPSGELTCAELDSDGFAPPGQANGAFIDALDPVLLAFQFLRIGGQITGGNGIPITDGTFEVPAGTAGFQVVLSAEDWALQGPEGSGLQASNQEPGIVGTTLSGGATKLSVQVGDDATLIGQWQFDSSAAYAELYLFSGLTLELDRDKISTILSEFDNTLTGRVARTQEYRTLPVDLDQFPGAEFSMSVLENGVLQNRPIDLQVTPTGQFKIERFNPGSQSGELELWLTLDLGRDFQPITSRFVLAIVDKSALAIPASDVLTLSTLEGPTGVATGVLTITGPNISDSSVFCISETPLRLDDSQAKSDQPVSRLDSFSWSFVGLSQNGGANCVEVARDQSIDIVVEARNATQANAAVVSSWQVTSTTLGTAASYDAPIVIQFESVTQSNTAVEIAAIVILLIGGLLLPLIVMWLINLVMTRFLPIENMTRASFPVVIDSSGGFAKVVASEAGSPAGSISVKPDDFKNQMDQSAIREYATGLGVAKGRVPLFPLAATWYEWQAPSGHRLISSFDGASKHSKDITAGKAVEISPNMAENWALVVPESELRKPTTESVSAELIVFARMSNLAAYQKRVGEISLTPGLGEQLGALKSALENETPEESGGLDSGPTTEIPVAFGSTPPGFTSSSSPDSGPLAPPKAPRSGPLAPPPPPQ